MSFRTIVLTCATLLVSGPLAWSLELKDITYDTANAGKVVFSHKIHLSKKSKDKVAFSCGTCHADRKSRGTHYTMAQMENGKSCGACHNSKKAFALAECARCHKVKDVTYSSKQYGKVHFSHNKHLEKYRCDSCHSAIFRTGNNPTATMAQMAKGKSCGACHNGKAAFSVSECIKCHPYKNTRYVVADAGDVTFSHESHLGNYSCGNCHDRLFKPVKGSSKASMASMEKGKSCGACHDGKTAFTVAANCASCHKVQQGSSLSGL